MQYTYEEIALLNYRDGKASYLVRQTETGLLAIKKAVDVSLYQIYSQIKGIYNANLMVILDVEIQDNECIVIEEYINGETLEELLLRVGRLDEKTVKEYLTMLCSAVEALHRMNIIHRDISPYNVMLTTDGVLKLCDFDISRIYKENQAKDTYILGTPGYSAPEQFGYGQTGVQSDIFAIGALANTMLTGNVNIKYKRWGRLSRGINKAMSYNQSERFPSIYKMSEFLSLDIKARETRPFPLFSYITSLHINKWLKLFIAVLFYYILIYVDMWMFFRWQLNWVNLIFYGIIPWIIFIDLFHISKNVFKLDAGQRWFRIIIGLSIQILGYFIH